MKKIRFISALLALIMVLSAAVVLASCGGDPADTDSNTEAQETEDMNYNPADPSFYVIKEEEYDGVTYVYLTGVTEEAKTHSVLEVPVEINGKTICGIEKGAFKGCDKLVKITVHSNVVEWMGNVFEGCTNLREIIMDYSDFVKAAKADPSVAQFFTAAAAYDGSLTGKNSIIEGLDSSKIAFYFADSETKDYFAADYTWGAYANIMKVQ